MKRIIDIILAIAIMPFIAIISIPIVISIRMDSPGPALFKQIRVGKNKREFILMKWRTMAIDTGNSPSHEASPEKITRVGSFLRHSKLDELPQIYNVIIGEMSFVGPRPCLPSQEELISQRDKLGVYNLRPGITGVSQLAGLDMSDPERLALTDASYISKMGMIEDLRILVKTLFSGRGDAIKS